MTALMFHRKTLSEAHFSSRTPGLLSSYVWQWKTNVRNKTNEAKQSTLLSWVMLMCGYASKYTGRTDAAHWNIDTTIKLHAGVNTWECLYLMDKGGQWFQSFWIVNTLRQRKLKHCYTHAWHFSHFLYIFWNANLIDVIAGRLRLGFNKGWKRSE